jgi:hypothetical protein
MVMIGPYHCRKLISTSFAEGMLVHIVEEEDGSGWVKVSNNAGGKGLVPASYVEIVDSADVQQSLSTSQGSGQYGKSMSFFDLQSV